MNRSNLMRIILIAGSVLIIIGVSVMGWTLATEDEMGVIEVQVEDGKTQSVEFKDLRLVPGGECSYTVKLERPSAEQYDLKLKFVETEEKTLKNFAHVKILAAGKAVYDKLLAEAFRDEGFTLPVDFAADKNTELTVVYYLPIEVGNEAKNAEAVFELLLTASNE